MGSTNDKSTAEGIRVFPFLGGRVLFRRIKSCLSTRKKHAVSPSDALNMLFTGKKPAFMLENM
jgi:hypothetical protein